MADKIRQISLSHRSENIVLAKDTDHKTTAHEYKVVQDALIALANGIPWPRNLNHMVSPHVIYYPPAILDQLSRLNRVLNKALDSIVQRWWTDKDFPQRMPLESFEEDLLKWLDGSKDSRLQAYTGRQGIWRPDFLIELGSDDTGRPLERVKICELNGRFPYNGTFMVAHAQQAVDTLRNGRCDLPGTFDTQRALDTLVQLFDSSKPLHILQEEWPGADISFFAQHFRERTGQPVTFIKPSQVRLHTPVGSVEEPQLYCSKSAEADSAPSGLEKIYQCSVELIQKELAQLEHATLQTIAQCCINDFRTILLVHDKRMLGIVLEEADNLVDAGVITSSEAQILRDGIAPTILPATKAFADLVQQCQADSKIKDLYVLKSIRGGLGIGHFFGSHMSNEEWLERLRCLKDAKTISEQTHLIQRVVEQQYYDIRRHAVDGDEDKQFHLIGTYYSVNGKYLCPGPIRIGVDRGIMVKAHEGGIVSSSVTTCEAMARYVRNCQSV